MFKKIQPISGDVNCCKEIQTFKQTETEEVKRFDLTGGKKEKSSCRDSTCRKHSTLLKLQLYTTMTKQKTVRAEGGGKVQVMLWS